LKEGKSLKEEILELIRRTSADLPHDVEDAIRRGYEQEKPGSMAKEAMSTILKNIQISREKSTPICQDTGTNIYYIYAPVNQDFRPLREHILEATRDATKLSYLRPNAVDSISGKNSGDNTGRGLPVIHFEQWEKDFIRVDLMLKGGGSENVSSQYSLPFSKLEAGRDLKGVKKVVLDAIFQAQGKGCSPGFVGVCIGGDRNSGYEAAKKTLFTSLDQSNPDSVFRDLENEIFEKANQLDIGPMGFGGRTTILGVKFTSLHRVPASFFVSVAYLCWAVRRRSMTIKGKGVQYD
jgi:fumarate hydratase class I